jgi:hypothetical protein
VVLGLFVRALFAFQRRTARRLGVSRPLAGAVAFVQRFGSALQLTPHFHVLVPEAVFEELDNAELRLHPLPRPTDAEVETLAVTVARRTLALLRARGVLEEEAVANGVLDVLQLARHPGATERAASSRSPAGPPDRRPHLPSRKGTRRVVAVVLRSSTAQAILEHVRLPSRPLPFAPAASPPQLGLW